MRLWSCGERLAMDPEQPKKWLVWDTLILFGVERRVKMGRKTMEMRGRWDDRWGTILDYTTGEVAITRKYQPLFLWSVLTFQLAFIHSLGRTSRHTFDCFAHHAPDMYNSPPLPYPSTTTIISHLLLHALYRKIPIPTTPKTQRKTHASTPPRRTFIFGQTSITPATANPPAAGRREHGELGSSSSNAKRLQRRRRGTPSTILPHRLTAPYQQRRRRRRGQRRSRATRSPTPTNSQ